MLKQFAPALFMVALVTACATPTGDGEVRIDSSSHEAAEASYSAMMQDLSATQKQQLALAVFTLNMEGVESAYEVVGNPELQSPSIGRIKDKVAAMTADEIVALAARTSSVRIDVPEQ